MKIAVDKTNYKKVKPKQGDEIVYIFKDENLKTLVNTQLHCVNEKYCEGVDINLTNYKINCFKKAKITDKNWYADVPEKNYKFAIIIPSYNNDHSNYKDKTFLQNCIESVLNQTYKNFELIIVDDCSTDTSIQTIKSYKDKRIHLIQNKRKRYNGGSRNVGIDYALDNLDFDYFCFIDSDDWWKHNEVLEHINNKLYYHEMAIIGAEMLFQKGVMYSTYNDWQTYQDFFMSIGKTTLWCTAWCRIIRKDKIVWFCEDTLMEDRVWSYKQADNIDYDKVINIREICYVWNRMNTSQSVSQVRDDYWNASAWCHIGHQKQFISQLKHIEMKPILEERLKKCIDQVNKAYINNINERRFRMIKLQAKENFTLGEFNKIKNLVRINPSKSEDGRLMKGDVFEADEKLAKYLLNETSNPVNRAVVDLVEVEPEVKKEIKEEIKEMRAEKKIPKAKKTNIAKK